MKAFALITYLVQGYNDPTSQLFRIEPGQDKAAIAAVFTRQMNPVKVLVVSVDFNDSQGQNTMPSKTTSTFSLHTLWRNCYRLNQQISLHQKRAQLLQMEINGLTEPTSEETAIVVDPRIANLQRALAEAIPLFKNALDQELNQELFEERLLGNDVDDPNRTDF